jgi:N-acetylglutamate synthase-like GNAT family acetyltransferase
MIRQAEASDIDQLLVLAENFIEYHPLGMRWDVDHMRAQLMALIEAHVFVIDEGEGKIRGAIGGTTIPNLWVPGDVMLVEAFWWVEPEYRNGTIGLKLLKAFEAVGRALQVSRIAMVSTTKTPQLTGIYQRLGYELQETTFSKEV